MSSSTMDKIKAVIFDWGGVLIDNPAPGLISYCSGKLGITSERFIVVCGIYLLEFQKGLISEAEFWKRVCKDLKIPIPSSNSLWGEAFRDAYSPKQEMFDLAASLNKANYKTALLSNTEAPAMEYFHKLDYQMFDVLVFSCAVKTRKPESKIYELTLGNLNVKPSEAIFIDDRIDYIEGAKKVGIKTILFESAPETKKKLESYSVLIKAV